MAGYALFEAEEAPAAASLALAVRAALAGRRLIYLDAANSFNPYLLARIVRRRRLDRSIFRRVLVSRAFTCHQLDALVAERLAPAARAHAADLVIASDVGALLYDEEVPLPEARRVAASIAASLRRGPGATVVVAGAPQPGREPLLALLRSNASHRLVLKEPPWDGPCPPLPSFSTPK
jgi:hypothetical protein